MWCTICLILSITTLNAREEIKRSYQCKFNAIRFRRNVGSFGVAIRTAIHSATSVLSHFTGFTGDIDEATKALKSLNPTEVKFPKKIY